MRLIELAVARPVAVAAGVILLLLFGFVSLTRIPIELTPEVVKPVVTVSTVWPGASPEEVEKDIIQEQEEQLKGVEGATRMTSSSADSVGTITLEFPVGTDRDAALVNVTNRLAQVPEYPQNVEEPVVRTEDPGANAMAWFVVTAREGSEVDVEGQRDLMEDYVKARFERVPGVAISNVFGGLEREIQVVVHPDLLVARALRVQDVIQALRADNINVSAGDIDEGKRRYVIRTLGEYRSPADVEAVVLRDDPGGGRIYVRDVGQVKLGFKEATGRVRTKGTPTIAVNVVQERGSNSLEVMKQLKAAARELDEGLLAERGLTIEQVYDQTVYILSSLSLVQQNLFIGGVLAIIVLLLFLGSVRPTIVVATAIPVSVLGAFVGMALLGRSLNVISLAGMAFAVGMVVDNAIVVLENIDRHHRRGDTAREAAAGATSEVWGAVLASSLTTIAVFLPVIFVEEQAGQLFRDLAVAICCAVGLSLFVAITVIPAFAGRVLSHRHHDVSGKGHLLERLVAPFQGFPDHVARVLGGVLGSTTRRIAVVGGLTLAALAGAWLLMPRAEYLPSGNRNLVFGIILPPPAYSLGENARFGKLIEDTVRPHWLPSDDPEFQQPGIDNFFFVALEGRAFLGASARDPRRVSELVPVLRGPLLGEPGVIPIVQQTSLFERGVAAGRSIDIELTGPDLRQLVMLGGQVFGQVLQMFPPDQGAQARPIPSLDLANPQVHVIPNRERLAEVGLSVAELGRTVDVLVDGSPVSDYQLDGQEIDLTLIGYGELAERTQDVASLRLFTPSGRLVTVGSVAQVVPGSGPEEIQHVERDRAITVQLIPPPQVPLEQAVERVEDEILTPMRAQGLLEPPYSARLSGTADDLRRTLTTLRADFLLALAISFLLMAALFESFLYPLVIMFSVPMAAVGGILGLRAVGLWTGQPMDILTMLGFIILVGVVVNNAILIVHQSLNLIRGQGMERQQAIIEATRSRVRPIFMTVATSVFGMLPLVLMPGAGSELYRGLGSVVVGGLVVSTAFTLLLIPALFSLVLELRVRLGSSEI